MKRTIQVFASFEDAERSEREERWAMAPERRLAILEELRRLTYPDGHTAPRLQRFFEIVERS